LFFPALFLYAWKLSSVYLIATTTAEIEAENTTMFLMMTSSYYTPPIGQYLCSYILCDISLLVEI